MRFCILGTVGSSCSCSVLLVKGVTLSPGAGFKACWCRVPVLSGMCLLIYFN